METFFNATWFVWWLLAVAAIARWYWMNLGPGAQNDDNDDDSTHWKELYRIAVQECDSRRMLARIEVAGGAILRRMNDQRDDESAVEQKALEDARKESLRVRILRSLHVTSVFVTHDQEEAREVADLVVVMNNGRIEQVGSPTRCTTNRPRRLSINFWAM